MKTATEKLKDEARSAKVKGNIDEATEKNVVKNANLVNRNLTVQIGNTKATTEQTKQATQNLKQDEIQKTLENELRKNGIQPGDNATMRIVSKVITNGADTAAVTKGIEATDTQIQQMKQATSNWRRRKCK